MINPFHLLLGSRPYLRAAIRTSVLIVGSLSCFAAYGVLTYFVLTDRPEQARFLRADYPISGVWVAMDQRFPVSKTGACLTLKTLGADALFDGPFPTVMIFSVGERFVVRGGRSAELAIRSVKSAKDGSFHITESLGKLGGWLPWFKSRALHLKVLDPMVIEVTEGPVSTRFFKCSSDAVSPRYRWRAALGCCFGVPSAGEELHLRPMLSRMGRLKASRIIQSKTTLAVASDQLIKEYNSVRMRRISVVAGEANAQIGVMSPKALNLTDRMPSLLRSKRDAGSQFWAGATGT